MTRPSDTEFVAFLAAVEPRVRRALAASLGASEGRSATQASITWAWEHWSRVIELNSPVGYLYRVGMTSGVTQTGGASAGCGKPLDVTFLVVEGIGKIDTIVWRGLPSDTAVVVLDANGSTYWEHPAADTAACARARGGTLVSLRKPRYR
ncbi:MAG: hypothetical protein Q7V57_13325 [Actinomycetota bacterium]|nr:hypothetical protein [Actinomycetota bacterium]